MNLGPLNFQPPRWTMLLILTVIMISGVQSSIQLPSNGGCYFIDWTTLNKYVLSEDSYLLNNFYSFHHQKSDKNVHTNHGYYDSARNFTFDFCKSTLPVQNQTKTWKSQTGFKIDTFDKVENQTKFSNRYHLYSNNTFAYTINTEGYFLSLKLKPRTLEEILRNGSGEMKFSKDDNRMDRVVLYTDGLDIQALYIKDDKYRRLSLLFGGISLLVLGYSMPYSTKIYSIRPLGFFMASGLTMWFTNLALQVSFYQTTDIRLAILCLGSLGAGVFFTIIHWSHVSFLYLMLLISLLDMVLYTGIFSLVFTLPIWFVLVFVLSSTSKTVYDSETQHEWTYTWVIGIQSVLLICSAYHMNPTAGAFIQIFQPSTLDMEIQIILSLSCTLFILVIVLFRFYLLTNRASQKNEGREELTPLDALGPMIQESLLT